MRLQCLACGGTYDDVLPDGLQYFHACPPLAFHELQAAVAAGDVVLTPGEKIEDAFRSRTFPRPDARDENVVPSPVPNAPATIKREGKGVAPAAVDQG
jgi:hypothetical protein